MSSYSGSGSGYNGGNYTSGYARYNSSYNNNRADGTSSPNNVPASQRPDGSYREEIRVRPGYVPEGEKQAYIPPAARSNTYTTPASYSNISKSSSQDSSDERVDSWADETAPVLNEINNADSKSPATAVVTESIKTEEIAGPAAAAAAAAAVNTSETVDTTVESEKPEIATTEIVREPRKPNQLATAIDTAIDSLNLGGSNGGDPSTRPIGRFAAQIANDEREGRPAYRRYDSPSGYYNREGSGYNNRDSQGYNNYGNRSSYNNSNNWNRSNYQNESANQQSESASETRVDADFKSFLEDLSLLRKEMAVINAKLEYIRYIKAHDEDTLTEIEATRLKLEPTLLTRLDAIFESIDALSAANK